MRVEDVGLVEKFTRCVTLPSSVLLGQCLMKGRNIVPRHILKTTFVPWGVSKSSGLLELQNTAIEIAIDYEANKDMDNKGLRDQFDAVFKKLCTHAMKWYKRDVIRLNTSIDKAIVKAFVDEDSRRQTILEGGIMKQLEMQIASFNTSMSNAFNSWLEAVQRHINKTVEVWNSANSTAIKIKAQRGAGMVYDTASIAANAFSGLINPKAAASAASSAKELYKKIKSGMTGIETKRKNVQEELDLLVELCEKIQKYDEKSWIGWAKKKQIKMSSVTSNFRAAITEYELSVLSMASSEKKMGTEVRKLQKANKADGLKLEQKINELAELHAKLAEHTASLRNFRDTRKQLIKDYDLRSKSEALQKSAGKAIKSGAISLRKKIVGERQYVETMKRLDFQVTIDQVTDGIKSRKHCVHLQI